MANAAAQRGGRCQQRLEQGQPSRCTVSTAQDRAAGGKKVYTLVHIYLCVGEGYILTILGKYIIIKT